MNRRTFVLLSGAASAALWRPPRLFAQGVDASAPGNLRFDLDEQRRWSLWYHGADQPVPLLRHAILGVLVGDTLTTLGDLQDISVGNRRPPGGESLVLRGRTPGAPDGTGGVWIEAEFAAWDAPASHGTVTVSVFPDRVLATIRGVRFFAAPDAQILPGTGPLYALLNGYQSSSPSRVATLPSEGTSHGALGLTRERRGLAFVGEAGEAGEAKFKMSGDGLEGISEWTPGRPVRPEGDTATLRLGFLSDGDGLAALGTLMMPQSSVDRERIGSLATPTGWSTRSEFGSEVTEADVLANLDFCAENFDPRFLRYIQIDDGYQRAAGDWDTNAKFPHGHRWLTDRIHGAGFLAGLWVAPFAVAERSPPGASNPAWLVKDGERILGLDGAHPDVQQWLFDLARRIVRDWGYDYLKADLLGGWTAGTPHYGGLTQAEAYRRGLAAIRDGLGTEAFLLGSGAPLQHAAGLVNGMRIADDVAPSWSGIQPPARAAALRSFYHRNTWINDPAALIVRAPLTIDEARAWASVVAASAGMTMLSDNLTKLPAERLPLLQKTLPVSPVAGRPVGTQVEETEVAPAVVAGDATIRIRGPWRFRTGDDARYADRAFDDDAWETMAVPLTWEQSGHADYDGVAWYRTRFTLPASRPAGEPAGMHLELGRVDDIDETYVNGTKIGATSGWRPYRRYVVPGGLLNWGGENVLAVRVTDSGGAGGFWSVRRNRPAATWVVEGAPRWWTVVLVNWDEEPRTIAQSLAAIGIPGARFNAYDVWADQPAADVPQTLSATIPPHTTLTLALRPALARPQIIGTTRHVIQGGIDIADERWDAATRTLSGKSQNLDGRPYAITIALARGSTLRPRACKAEVPCQARRLTTGHVVLDWPAGTTADLNWSVSFSQPARR